MKLLSAHIKNFGTLSDKDYKFNNGINPFIENNGAGKSTLAAFLKAMLFGMDSVRENDKDFKERKHYAPFNNQIYGGTLDFEHNGKTYHIERTFDVKSSTKDDLNIYIDKVLRTDEFENEIGETILGLNKESFERLLFVSFADIEMASNGNIKKNLNNIIDDATEGVDFDSVNKKLEEVIKLYSNKKGSYTAELKDKKNMLETDIGNQEQISNALSDKYEKRNQINEDLQELIKKQKANSEIQALKECWETYNGKISGIETKQKELDELLKSYPKCYPTAEELEKLKELINDKKELEGKAKGISFAEKDEQKLIELKKMFEGGVPSDEDINTLETRVKEYNQINTILSVSKNELTAEEQDIVSKYSNKNLSEDLKKAKQLVDEYKEIETTLTSIPKFEEQPVKQNTKKPVLPLVILILSIVVTVVGVVLFFINIPSAIACTVVGVLGLIVTGFLYLKSKIDSSNKSGAKINSEFEQQSRKLSDKEKEIHVVLTPYGIYTQSVHSDLSTFEDRCNRYDEITKKQSDDSKAKEENAKKLQGLEKQIKEFLDKYISYQSFDGGVAKIKEEIKEYSRLTTAYSLYEKARADNLSSITSKNEEIKSIDDKYELGILDNKRTYEVINSDVIRINLHKKDIETAKQDAEQYRQDKELADEEPSFDEVQDYSSIIQGLTTDLAKIEKEIDQDELDIENLEDNRKTLIDLKDEIKANERFHGVLTKTEEILKSAQKNLDDKYVAPIMERFDYYSALLGRVLGFKIVMGREFNIMLEVDGEYKSDEHLSSGQRSICALCFRLALLDNIYNGQLPFIIMDDPFMTLDADNMKSTTAMLKALAKDKQIIYFSCHDSRAIK